MAQVLAGRMVCVHSVEDIPDPVERASLGRYGTNARVSFPLVIDSTIEGAISF
jgi:hypothetical protein